MVVDADGHIVAHNDAARVGGLLADGELRRALAAGESTVLRHLDLGRPVYAAAVPVLQGGKPVAAVLVGFDAEVISAKVRQMLVANLAVGVLVLLAGALVLLLTLSAFVTRPIAALVQQITGLHERGKDDSARRVTEQWQDEFGELARSFNALMQELERTTVSTGRLAAEVEERKRAQAVLDERSQDLARSNAELEQLAYVASHDLQEPLRMVASYLQLVEKRYADRLDADGHEFIGYAVDGAKRMQALINDLLAYSRTGVRGGPLQPVDSGAVLDTAVANLGMAIGENEVRIQRGALPTVLGDPTPLVQLFQNLIGNAVKFRSERPPVISVDCEPDGAWWRFSVTDNGIGIDAEYRERVFVLFQRLHGRTEYPGTGIGLAICKRIVERHGGRIWIEDAPGGGTRFVFTLRRGEGAAAPRVSDKTATETRPVH
jgi:signal transduction histidine kinase